MWLVSFCIEKYYIVICVIFGKGAAVSQTLPTGKSSSVRRVEPAEFSHEFHYLNRLITTGQERFVLIIFLLVDRTDLSNPTRVLLQPSTYQFSRTNGNLGLVSVISLFPAPSTWEIWNTGSQVSQIKMKNHVPRSLADSHSELHFSRPTVSKYCSVASHCF